MSEIENIVSINITRETQGVTRTGFGTPLFVGTSIPLGEQADAGDEEIWTERVRAYTSLEAVEEDWEAGTPEHTAAQRVFGQQVKPNYFKIGRMLDTDTSYAEAVSAIQDEDDDWYFLMTNTRDPSSIQLISEWAQAQRKLYFTSYDGEDALDSTLDSDVGSILSDMTMDRTVIIFTRNADQYPEAAWVGLQAPKNPGSTTWKFKGVTGVSTTNLTPTERLTLKGDKYDNGKGYNVYTNVAGSGMFSEGRTVGGEFIDTMRFADWLEVRMRERIFLTLRNSEKIPQTRQGYAVIEGRMREVLTEGVRRGGLASFTVTVPDPNNADPNELINRVASGFKFRARLAGAIHFVEIEGTLTVEEV